MATELTLSLVQKQVGKLGHHLVNEQTIQEINKLCEDPDYGEEFIDSYLTHLNLLRDSHRQNHNHYINALRFFTLVEAGNNLTNAYVKVFPERYEAREKKNPGEGYDKIRTEASRFNNTNMVNEIRRVAAIPVQLIHRHLLHESILEQANLMRTAKSEMVRHKAADSLMRELKPAQDNQLNIKIDDGSSSFIDQLQKAAEELAIRESRSVEAGVPLKEIANSRIIEGEIEEVGNEDGS